MSKKDNLYHFHRQGIYDDVWSMNNHFDVTKNFQSSFYENILMRERILKEKFTDYDIDTIIKALEMMEKDKDCFEYHKFASELNDYYIFRRELALEEGRKIYNNLAPSRLHSIYLSDEDSLYYWMQYVGFCSRLLEVEVRGDIFESSDWFFPDVKSSFEIQVRESKKYWQPKDLTHRVPKEYLFQGSIKIKGVRVL